MLGEGGHLHIKKSKMFEWKNLLLVAPMGTFSLPGEENLSEQGSVYRWGYNLPTSLPILDSSVFQCTSAEKIVAETWSLVQS